MVVDRAAGVAAANLFTAVEPADAALHRVGERGGLFESDDCAVEWVGRVANVPPLYKGTLNLFLPDYATKNQPLAIG